MNALEKQVGGSHYKDNFKIQPSKFITKNKLLFNEGCVIKYVCRHPHKGMGRLDLEKAKHYIDIIIEENYPEEKHLKQPECVSCYMSKCEGDNCINYCDKDCTCKCHEEENGE